MVRGAGPERYVYGLQQVGEIGVAAGTRPGVQVVATGGRVDAYAVRGVKRLERVARAVAAQRAARPRDALLGQHGRANAVHELPAIERP